MIGMNLVFHLAAAVGTLALAYVMMRFKRERDFLRALLREVAPKEKGRGGGRVYVEEPAVFLRNFARSLGIPYDEHGKVTLEPRPVAPGALARLHVVRSVSRIALRSEEGSVQVCFTLVTAAENGDNQDIELIESALGDGLSVSFDLVSS